MGTLIKCNIYYFTKWLFLVCIFSLATIKSSAQRIGYGTFVVGTPLWNNKGGDYIIKDYFGIWLRVFPDHKVKDNNKWKMEWGESIYFDIYSINDAKLLKSIDKLPEFMDKTSAYYGSFKLGPALRWKKEKGRYTYMFGGSVGFDLAFKGSYSVDNHPKDTVLAGYSSANVQVYGKFPSYGYYIMPATDISYNLKVFDNLTVHFGLNCYFSDVINHSVYQSTTNRQTSSTIVNYRERLMAFGFGFQFGFAGKI